MADRLLGHRQPRAMLPLPLPVVVGAASGGTYADVAPLLRLAGYTPVQITGSEDRGEEAVELKPGMPVGAVWMTGDLQLASMGTATMVEEGRVVAFGHPMSGNGRSNLPLATGRVEAVIPSYRRSFRLASIDRIVGRMTQDRQAGIVGRIGEKAPMFDCTVHVSGEREDVFRYRVAGYWRIAPMASFYATVASALRWEGSGTPETVLGVCRIRLKGREKPILLKNLYAGLSPLPPAQDLVLAPLSRLVLNPFGEVEIQQLNVNLQIQQGIRSAEIESVRADRSVVGPGETLGLRVRLREFQGDEYTRRLDLHVPANARPGTAAQVVVSGSDLYRLMERSLDPGFYDPESLEGLIEAITKVPSSTEIYVRAGFIRRGVRYDGTAMPGLPGSAARMLMEGTDAGRSTPLLEDETTSLDTHWVVRGAVRLSVRVGERNRAMQLSE
jgi:hypothetical protein